MRRLQAIALTLSLGASAGCGEDSPQLSGPILVDSSLPHVVATPSEIEALGDAARDPYLGSLLAALTPEDQASASLALQEFELGLAVAPATSFAALERRLATLTRGGRGGPDPDAELVLGTLDVYRDWSAKVLFGVDPETLAPRSPHGT